MAINHHAGEHIHSNMPTHSYLTEQKWNRLLVFSSLVFEVIYSLPEEGDTEQTTVVVFKQQPGEEDIRKYINMKAECTPNLPAD